MAALTQETARTYSELDRHNPIQFQLQKANATCWKNGLCVKVSGKAQPAVANTAGQTLLGWAEFTYVAGGSDTAWTSPPMIFKQGVGEMDNDSGDPVVVADIGSDVYLSDDNTVHHTNAGNDVAVRCKYITPAGKVGVEVKNP